MLFKVGNSAGKERRAMKKEISRKLKQVLQGWET